MTTPITIEKDVIFLTWQLLRQGEMLCMLLQENKPGYVINFNKLKVDCITEAAFSDAEAVNNVNTFLKVCEHDLYQLKDQLFETESLFCNGDRSTPTLKKALTLCEKFLDKIERMHLYYKKNKSFWFNKVRNVTLIRDQRLRALQTFLKSERQYMEDIVKLQALGEELLRQGILPIKSIEEIFYNLDEVVEFLCHFLEQVEAEIKDDSTFNIQSSYAVGIGGLFINNENGFKVYEKFCGNRYRALATLKREEGNLMSKGILFDRISEFIHYLMTPHMKIFEYPSLIDEMKKGSGNDAPDLAELEVARIVLERVLYRVDKNIADQQMALEVENLSARLRDWNGVRIDKLGSLLVSIKNITVSFNDEENIQEMKFYTFQNFILFCKSMSDSSNAVYVYKSITPSQIIEISDLLNGEREPAMFTFTYKYGPVVIERVTLTSLIDDGQDIGKRVQEVLKEMVRNRITVVALNSFH